MITISVPEYFESLYVGEKEYDEALIKLVQTGYVSFKDVAMCMFEYECVSERMLTAIASVTGRSVESYKDMQNKFLAF